MPAPTDRVRRLLPSGLTGLAGAAYCVLPVLLTAGVLGGAGWAAVTRFVPGVAVALAVLAGLAWWWAGSRRHCRGCAGGTCSCTRDDQRRRPARRLRSDA
ncbi:hypothetical protein MRQ36_01510 [Micromonospora sp. R77]|uniref:hypothetical protein n=1 Tax=Micromonospora sp. R77 TaxID=2925836 RepID=UPI001F6154BD|nr:hypothetical protein [Micromonospora sp. R77]MCI4061318.1 hypothetical protein [Micromonospora sp. R77]